MYKCWTCGKELPEGTYKRNFCPECAKAKAETAKATFNEYWRLKNIMTLERAVSRIEDDDSSPDIEDLREAIETVREYVEKNPQKLDSTEEYIALIILLHNRVHTICQYKILNYVVDFCLPEMKVILEVDGDRHSKVRDAKRDLEILGEIGADWTIIRFPTKYINSHPKSIYDAILDYQIEYERQKKETPGIVLQRVKAIDAAKEERIYREAHKEMIREMEQKYANGYIYKPRKKK